MMHKPQAQIANSRISQNDLTYVEKLPDLAIFSQNNHSQNEIHLSEDTKKQGKHENSQDLVQYIQQKMVTNNYNSLSKPNAG